MIVKKLKRSFPEDHPNFPSLIYEYEKDSDGETRERAYYRGEDVPDWTSPAADSTTKAPDKI